MTSVRYILILLALGLALWGGTAVAQDTPRLSILEIGLWPEYDRPEMLVIYQGFLAPDTALPSALEVRIPARVGQPTAVAFTDGAGQRFNLAYDTRVEGEWLVVSFQLSTTGFQLEYYDALPVSSSGARGYRFHHVADYDIGSLSLGFMVPPTAESFTLDPPASSVIQESNGLTYHIVQAGAVTRGQALGWTLNYQKGDAQLTEDTLQPAAPAVTALAPEQSDNTAVLIFAVSFLALISVGAAAFWLGRRTQAPSETPPARPPRGDPLGQRAARRGQQEMVAFCYQCGAQLRRDSVFCHKCGAAVRHD
jgi:hypothetical protein